MSQQKTDVHKKGQHHYGEIAGNVVGTMDYVTSDSEDEKFLRDFNRRSRITTSMRVSSLSLRPPLPLITFKGIGIRSEEAKTITGHPLRPIINHLSPELEEGGDLLQDISYTRKLQRWCTARNVKEAAVRQPKAYLRLVPIEDSEINCVQDSLVYKAIHFDGDGESNSVTNSPRTLENDVVGGESVGEGIVENNNNNNNLEFDAKFESGNLFKAVRVTGRHKLIVSSRTMESLQTSTAGFLEPQPVDQEYDLTLRNDLNTNGNIQWYYFGVSTAHLNAPSSSSSMFPLRVRFNIVNMQKKDALYNYGMKPAVFSVQNNQSDWRHRGEDVCYFKNSCSLLSEVEDNGKSTTKKKQQESSYVLTFTYTFDGPDVVYFAHTFPYTYTDLKKSLAALEEDPRVATIMHRKELCATLAGNNCEVVTITRSGTELSGGIAGDKSSGNVAPTSSSIGSSANKPAIIISARVHPGESNSSYMMQGVLEFLVSDCPEARALREAFVFKIVPMLNPDGVIHGNYRCSLIGTDLNRRYKEAHASMYPTVAAMKGLLDETQRGRGVYLFLDLHGHSKKKNAFCYGSDVTLQSEKMRAASLSSMTSEEIAKSRLFARTFPKVLSTLSDVKRGGYFCYRDSAFGVEASKRGTGRVVSWRDLGIEGSFTIEASFCGSGNNDEKKIVKKYEDGVRPLVHNSQLSGLKNKQAPSQYITVSSTPSNPSILTGNTGSPSIESMNEGIRSSGSLPTPSIEIAGFNTGGGGGGGMDLQQEYEEIMRGYRTLMHYTKQDLKDMGRDIVRAIYYYANLDESPLSLPSTQRTSMTFENGIVAGNIADRPPISSSMMNDLRLSAAAATASANVVTGSISSGERSREATSTRSSFDDDDLLCHGSNHSNSSIGILKTGSSGGEDGEGLHLRGNGSEGTPGLRIVEANADYLIQPLLKPTIYSMDAITTAYRDHALKMKDDHRLIRLKCEIAIRRALRMECPTCVTDSTYANEIQLPPEEEPDHVEEGEDGSDSDPSVDNVPTAKLFGKKGTNAIKDPKSMMLALCKAARKRRKAAEAAAIKREKQRLAELQEAAMEAAATAAALAKEKEGMVPSSTSKKTSSQVNTVRVLRGSGERIPLASRTSSSTLARGGNNTSNGNNAGEDVGGGGLPSNIVFAPGSNNQRPLNEQLNGRYTVRNKRPQSARIQRGSLNSSSSALNPEPQKVVNVVQLSPDGPYQPYTYDPRDILPAPVLLNTNRTGRRPSNRSSSALRGIGVPHAAPVPFFNRGGGVNSNSNGGSTQIGVLNRNPSRRSSSPRVMPVQMSFGALCKAVERLAEQISHEKT